MRILMISPYIPWPLHGGSSIRMYAVIKELSNRGHQLVLLAGLQKGAALPSDNLLNSLCEEVHGYHLPSPSGFSFGVRSVLSPLPYPALRFLSESLQENLHRLMGSQQFDLIWVNIEIMAYALSPDLVRDIPVVLDEGESQELVWKDYLQQGSWWQRLFALTNLAKLRRRENRILPMLKAILCVSDIEALMRRGKGSDGRAIWTVPNGVDLEFFRPASSEKKETNSILLCANMGVRRNTDGVLWFVKDMFPQIRREVPDAELWLVGSNPTQEVRGLQAIAGVHVTGTVEDVRPYYAKANVVVAPYRFGAGTKLKILEALACGTPIVSTSLGSRGIDVVDGQHLLIAENGTDFSNCVIELLNDPPRAKALAVAGRALVEQEFDWGVIVGAVEPKLLELVRKQQVVTAQEEPG